MTDFRNNPSITVRGIRNNNPFNLQKTRIGWQGKVSGNDPRFETFDNIENGIRAGVIDIVGDIGKDKQNTLSKLMVTFAPEHENDTKLYVNILSKATGIKPDEILNPGNKLDIKTIFHLSKAIVKHENGPIQSRFVTDAILLEGVKRAFESAAIRAYVTKPVLYSLPVPLPRKTGTTEPGLITPTIIMILIFSILILLNK